MTPLNRFLLVKMLEEEEVAKPTFYLPDDVITNKKAYEVVEIVNVSNESKFLNVLSAGDKVVVEGHMLRNVDVLGETATLIEDNYVLGKC